MTKILMLTLVVVIILMTILWAFGKALWWLRVTFPPKRPRSRRR